MANTNNPTSETLSAATCLPLLCDVGVRHGKPVVVRRILDLFCGAGGAAMGLHRAFPEAEIIGVDIKEQPRYPFKFVRGDAMEYPLEGFDFVWASPPCQRYSRFTPNKHKAKHPDLVPPIRERLRAWGGLFVIENVPCSPVRRDVVLTGAHFGSRLRRERWFETNFFVLNEPRPAWVGEALHFGGNSQKRRVASKEELQREMGIDWMTRGEMGQAIPPAYSEWVGKACRAIISTNGT